MNTLKQFKSMLLLLVAGVISMTNAKAAEPNWTVNPASFQYTMTMTIVLNINCVDMTNPSNRIAAFVDNSIRGTELTKVVTAGGKYIANLIVRSNNVKGEVVTFKIYNASNDSVYECKMTVQFQDGAIFGNSSAPYIIYSKYPCYIVKDVLPASNFISPNADGKNDVFWIDDVQSYDGYILTVYNEFELEVYKSNGNYNNDWAATYDGKTLPTGAYYYVYKNGTTDKEYKGIINIVKPN